MCILRSNTKVWFFVSRDKDRVNPLSPWWSSCWCPFFTFFLELSLQCRQSLNKCSFFIAMVASKVSQFGFAPLPKISPWFLAARFQYSSILYNQCLELRIQCSAELLMDSQLSVSDNNIYNSPSGVTFVEKSLVIPLALIKCLAMDYPSLHFKLTSWN